MKKHIMLITLLILSLAAIYFIPKPSELPLFQTTLELLTVKVDGAIKKPGYYTLSKGSTIYELIEQAGGLVANADISSIQFQEIVKLNSYYFPLIKDEIELKTPKYNLNTISFQELIKIPNITETRAVNILLYRQEYNQFYLIEDLLKVKGIGDATFEKIKDYFII